MDNFSPPVQEANILLSFPDALKAVIKGHRITRVSWDNNDEFGVLADNQFMIHTKGAYHGWVVNDGDLLAEDWIVIGVTN